MYIYINSIIIMSIPTGFFMYIDASDQASGYYADLVLPMPPGELELNKRQVGFYYHMYGNHINALLVVAISRDGKNSTLFSKYGEGKFDIIYGRVS